MTNPAKTFAPDFEAFRDWVPEVNVVRQTDGALRAPPDYIYSKKDAGKSAEFETPNFIEIKVGIERDGSANSSIGLPLVGGSKKAAATILDRDEYSVTCEVQCDSGNKLVSLPASLVPSDLHFGAPIWIRLNESSRVRRFEVISRVADPENLAHGLAEVDELIDALTAD